MSGDIGCGVGVGLVSRSVFTVEADTCFIHQRWRKRVRVTERCAHRIHELLALAKSTAVRETGKRWRKVARAVRPAIPTEQLVLFREVLVYAHVV